MKFQTFFDRSYIINLPERIDRRREMETELKAAGINPQSDSVEFFPAIKPTDKLAFPSIGVLGCYLSHLEILRTAKKKNLKNVLIMEDDLAIPKKFTDLEEKLVNDLSQTDWDIVFIGHLPYHSLGESKYSEQNPQTSMESSSSLLGKIIYPPRGTHFYAVNQKAYDKIIRFLEELLEKRSQSFYIEKDNLISDLDGAFIDTAYYILSYQNTDLNCLLTYPSLGGQRSSSSDISPGRLDKVFLVGSLLNSLRTAKYRLKKAFEA